MVIITPCKWLGHKPTWIILERDMHGSSAGFVCFRCGIRLSWDGRQGFAPIHDIEGRAEYIPAEKLREARKHRLYKRRHWFVATTEDNGCMLTPRHPDDLPEWVRKLDKE